MEAGHFRLRILDFFPCHCCVLLPAHIPKTRLNTRSKDHSKMIAGTAWTLWQTRQNLVVAKKRVHSGLHIIRASGSMPNGIALDVNVWKESNPGQVAISELKWTTFEALFYNNEQVICPSLHVFKCFIMNRCTSLRIVHISHWTQHYILMSIAFKKLPEM